MAEQVAIPTRLPGVIRRRRWLPRLRGNGFLYLGFSIIGLLILIAIFGPLIAPYDPDEIDLQQTLQGPSSEHLLGTDSSGRDIFSRLLVGTRLSLAGPLFVVVLSALVAIPLGLLAGYRGGAVDTVLSRTWDAMFAFPPLLLAIVIVAGFGAGFWTATIAITIIYVPLLARVVRGQVLVEREKAYVEAGRAQGFGGIRIAWRHILPNISPTIIAQSTLNFGYALIDLAALAFLGLGVQPPTADWGAMLAQGRKFILNSPGELIFASIAITVTVVAFNLLGDSLSNRLRRQ
jgi:peptide/nickel transport system permease protein